MFCIYLRTDRDLCHLQHKLIGFYNRDEKCLLHEKLCILTGITIIIIKVEEVVTLYNITTGGNKQKYQIDKAENPRNRLHHADISSVFDTIDDYEEPLW